MNRKTLTPVAIPAALICRHGKFFFFYKMSGVFSVNQEINLLSDLIIFMLETLRNNHKLKKYICDNSFSLSIKFKNFPLNIKRYSNSNFLSWSSISVNFLYIQLSIRIANLSSSVLFELLSPCLHKALHLYLNTGLSDDKF